MPRVSFVDQSAQDQDNIAANPARLLNLYPVPLADAENARTVYALKSVLGQAQKDNIGNFPIRAMGRGNEKNWLVGNGRLYEVSALGIVTDRGAVADDVNTTIAGNQSLVTIVSGNNYYTWNGTTIAQPTTKTFTNVGSHCYIGGFTVITEKNGKRFQWSAIGNAGSLNALDFASADKVDDNILRAVEFRGNLLLFCQTSTEIWSLDPDAPTNARRFFYSDITNTGLKDFNLFVRFDDALFFVGNDNRAYLFGQGVVSNTSVETSLAQNTPTHCFYYEDEGNKFCVIRFSDRPAWVFDITTGLWHERAEGGGFIRWRATCSVRNGSKWLAGNTSGQVMEFDRTNEDINGPLFRRAVSRSVYLGDRKFQIAKLELLARVGDHNLNTLEEQALSVGDGLALQLATDEALLLATIPADERDAWVEMYESGDGGRTWKGPKTRSMGRLNDFEQRMIWRARGQYQQYTVRFDISEPADITLYADGYVQAL
jgi:hypothetical protein